MGAPETSPARSIVSAVRAHLMLAAAVLLATVLASAVYIARSSPSYTATAQMLVNATASSDAPFLNAPLILDTGDPVRNVETAVILMDTQNNAALSARLLGAPWTATSVRGAVSIQPAGQSNIVDVSAIAPAPSVAAHLANVYVGAVLANRRIELRRAGLAGLRSVQSQLAGASPGSATATALQRQVALLQAMAAGVDPNMTAAAPAVPPDSSQGPRPLLVLALAVLIGLVLAVGAALLIETVTQRRVGTEGEVEDIYPLPVLARIPLRAPLPWRESFDPRNPGQDVQEALRSVRLQLELAEHRPRTILITSHSRNDGKTSTSIGLALELASSGATVILIDADLRAPQTRAGLHVERPPKPVPQRPRRPRTVESRLEPVPGLKTVRFVELRGLVAPGGPQVHVLPVEEAVRQAAGLADFVVIDTAPLGEISDALPLIRVVDQVLVVVRLRNSRRSSLEVTRDLLLRSGVHSGGYLVLGSSAPRYAGSYYYAESGGAARAR